MKRSSFGGSRGALWLTLAAAVGISLGAWQSASAQDEDGVFHACVNNENGLVRFVDGLPEEQAACREEEHATSFNMAGPPGLPDRRGHPAETARTAGMESTDKTEWTGRTERTEPAIPVSAAVEGAVVAAAAHPMRRARRASIAACRGT